MDASTGSAEPLGGGPPLERPLSRWARLLLPAELGAVHLDSADSPDDDGRELPRSARDWAVDLVLFGLAVIAAAVTAVAAQREVGTAMSVIDAALAVPACLSLWVRRRHPLAVAWLAAGLSAISCASIFAGLVAIFSAAIHARPRRAAEVAVGAIAAAAVDSAIYRGGRGHGGYNWSFLAIWTALTIAALAIGSFVRVRRQLVLSLHERTRRLESEQQLRARQAQLAERARIAREMHDVLAHRISLLSVHAGALEFNPDASPREIARAASVIRISARAAQEELREVIGVLRADPEAETVRPPQPTIADLEELIEECRATGMDVSLADQRVDQRLPPLVGRTVYRVVQEGLTNARKHAPGQPVRASIAGRPGAVARVEVINRPAVGAALGERGEAGEPGGRGRAGEPGGHVGSGTGLVGLAERVALAGGTLEHQPLPDGGFRLAATIPWALSADGADESLGGDS